MICQRFTLDVDDERLVGDFTYPPQEVSLLFLHGAGQSDRRRQQSLRDELTLYGCGSIAFDFSGHGDSSAHRPGSLHKRLREAECVLHCAVAGQAVHTVVATSMSGEIAIRLACRPENGITHLVILVGAIYDRDAFRLPFGPEFSAVIRQPQSWRNADTLEMIRHYRGKLSIVRALDDTVIPAEIADLLIQAAQSARRRCLVDLEGTDHRLSERLAQDRPLRQRIAAIILPEN